jgi:hypothetical protein
MPESTSLHLEKGAKRRFDGLKLKVQAAEGEQMNNSEVLERALDALAAEYDVQAAQPAN